jgi:hypothetical protein
MTHTHTGYRRRLVADGDCVRQRQRIPTGGKIHALTGGPELFTGLCGRNVLIRPTNEWGEPVPVLNVRPVGPNAATVTCKRCLQLMAR